MIPCLRGPSEEVPSLSDYCRYTPICHCWLELSNIPGFFPTFNPHRGVPLADQLASKKWTWDGDSGSECRRRSPSMAAAPTVGGCPLLLPPSGISPSPLSFELSSPDGFLSGPSGGQSLASPALGVAGLLSYVWWPPPLPPHLFPLRDFACVGAGVEPLAFRLSGLPVKMQFFLSWKSMGRSILSVNLCGLAFFSVPSATFAGCTPKSCVFSIFIADPSSYYFIPRSFIFCWRVIATFFFSFLV